VPARAPTVVGGRRRWRLRTGERTDALRSSGYPPLLQRLLANRGVHTLDEARRFLEGAPASSDPFLLPDMEAAVERLRLALSRGEVVAVFADFDVDGVTAAALLTEGLEALEGRVLTHIPDRFREGYGLNIDAIDRLRAGGGDLLLAADCGTSSLAEVEHARALGMDVLIVDHHAIPADGRLPPALALVNPKLGRKELGTRDLELGGVGEASGSQFPVPGSTEGLAAVGLAYHLLTALYESLKADFDPDQHLDLVVLGTVVDVAPLLGENRDLVRRGLAALARTSRPGLRALMKVAGIEPARVDTEALSFALGPRLNAAGRIAHARLAYDLLVTRDESEAARLAERLDDLNRERQRRTTEALLLAQELWSVEDPDSPLVMLGHKDFSSGVVGLVAARLAEELYRPAVVYELGERTSRASARSIPEFDIVAALRRCRDLFQRFGGHRQAAGFTADNAALPAIKQRLLEGASRELGPMDLAPTIAVDAPMPLRGLRAAEIRGLGLMAPHGMGNPRPTFLSRGVTVLECQVVGSDGRHLRLKLRDGPVVWPAIAFGMGEAFSSEGDGQEPVGLAPRLPEEGSLIDVVYSVSADRRALGRGDSLELEVLDFVPSA
jgi:single-stranded-DNA-specific exonuclease